MSCGGIFFNHDWDGTKFCKIFATKYEILYSFSDDMKNKTYYMGMNIVQNSSIFYHGGYCFINIVIYVWIVKSSKSNEG